MSNALVKFLSVAIITGAVFAIVYETFIKGNARGVDFVTALQTSRLEPTSIRSIQKLALPRRDTPFTEQDMQNLEVTGLASSTSQIEIVLSALRTCIPGRINQNHPVTTQHAILRVQATQGDVFYLWIRVLEDASSRVCYLDAGAKNGTNPNGTTPYHVPDYVSLLSVFDRSAGK